MEDLIEFYPIEYKKINTKISPHKGTTTLSFITKDGIFVAVDSRATAGSYIATQSINKVLEISPFLLGTMAGCAADCMFWESLLGIYARDYELKYKRRITAAAASTYLSNCIYQYKGSFSMGTMVVGYDGSKPAIYYVDDEGVRVKGQIFSVGSGSLIAYGALSSYRYDMEKEEALVLARNAIFHAGHRDAYSGGNVNLYFVNEDGWEKVGTYDMKDLHEEVIKYEE